MLWRWLVVSLSVATLVGCAGGRQARHGETMRQRTLTRAAAYGLVEVPEVVPGILVDLRYGSANNFTGKAVYPPAMPCLLLASTAAKVKRAQALLNSQGYGLKVLDAWRPPEVQEHLHAASAQPDLFLDPTVGWSRHCGGVAVDATLVDHNGNEMPMPTAFDEAADAGSRDSSADDPATQRNVTILHHAMSAAGLIPLKEEWWHFDDSAHIRAPVPIVRASHVGIVLSNPAWR